MNFDRDLRMIVVSPRQRKAAELRSKGDVWLVAGLVATISVVSLIFFVSYVEALAPLAIAWFFSLIAGLQYHVRAVHHEGRAEQERLEHLDALRGVY